MARIQIPPPDVAPIILDPDTKRYRWTDDWYDVLKGLERLGLLDLADVAMTAPTNGQVLIYSSANKNFAPGAN